MKKKICETGTFDDWHRAIVKDVNQKIHVMVDGYPHTITDWVSLATLSRSLN